MWRFTNLHSTALIIQHIIQITTGKRIRLLPVTYAALQSFYWPQTKVSGYIPFGNTATTCASFANNTNGIIALWANNPNGSTYSSSFSSTTPWDADFQLQKAGLMVFLPSASILHLVGQGLHLAARSQF